MGISKIGPNKFRIKARVVVQVHVPGQAEKKRDDRRKREVFTGTRLQAEERYLAIRSELRGEKPAARTFGEVLDVYAQNRGGIPKGQRPTFNVLMADLGSVPMEALEGHLGRYLPLLRQTLSKTSGAPISNGSINRLRGMALAALNLAVGRKIIPAPHPLTKAIWPKLKEIPRDRMLTAEEEGRLLPIVAREAPHLLPMLKFALAVPCRKSELVRMRIEDLNLFGKPPAIRVRNGTTKNDLGVWKPIPDDQVAYFRSIPKGCPWLFYKVVKGEFRPLGDFKTSWWRCLKLAGIEDFHFHDSRRISATAMVNAGTPERVVMKVAGWKENMLDRYWGSLGQEHLNHVRFGSGSGTQVAPPEQEASGSGQDGKERAVS